MGSLFYMVLRGSNAAGFHQWDEEGNKILLGGVGSQIFGVQTQFGKVFHRRGDDGEKQLFCCFFVLLGLLVLQGQSFYCTGHKTRQGL